jgi:KaiC/GvpD/RAD55 family RecA-like ATPase/FixJ family two-component response regulator
MVTTAADRSIVPIGAHGVVSTGIGALDTRLGTLVPGRHYLITGAPGTGKTTAALHFLAEGLDAGETCALLTQDGPDDLLAHGDYIGYDFRPALQAGRLVFLQFRVDFLRRYSRLMNPQLIYDEVAELLAEDGLRPARLVIDSVAPFLEGGHVSNDLIDGLGKFLHEWEGTCYLTVPGELREASHRRLYDRVVASAAGVFHIERLRGAQREFSISKLRQKAHDTEPFSFVIRAGAGIVDELPNWDGEALPPQLRRRVLVLDEQAAVPATFLNVLGTSFQVEQFRTLESCFSEIAAGRYGVLIRGVDPYRPNTTLDLAYSLRKAGNGAPMVFVSPREGLRGSTRARALRAGGDDFITADSSPVELLERIDTACSRGHRRGAAAALAPAPMQPISEDGTPRLMDAEEFRLALRQVMDQPTPPLFALITLRPLAGSERAWTVLREQVRLEDGDMVAWLDGGELAVYLGHVDPGTASELAKRLSDAHGGPVGLLRFPADRSRIDARLLSTAAGVRAFAAAR